MGQKHPPSCVLTLASLVLFIYSFLACPHSQADMKTRLHATVCQPAIYRHRLMAKWSARIAQYAAQWVRIRVNVFRVTGPEGPGFMLERTFTSRAPSMLSDGQGGLEALQHNTYTRPPRRGINFLPRCSWCCHAAICFPKDCIALNFLSGRDK